MVRTAPTRRGRNTRQRWQPLWDHAIRWERSKRGPLHNHAQRHLHCLARFRGRHRRNVPHRSPDSGVRWQPVRHNSGPRHSSTIYKYTPASGTFSTIYQFDNAHGEAVVAPLIQGSDGNLYGTAQGGGAHNCGTVFKMNRSGVILLYRSFPCGAGGALPSAPLVQASDGNFYGTTFEGGSGSGQGNGTIFRISQKGAIAILHRFGGAPDGSSVSAGLVQAADGNLYGTTAGVGVPASGRCARLQRAVHTSCSTALSRIRESFPRLVSFNTRMGCSTEQPPQAQPTPMGRFTASAWDSVPSSRSYVLRAGLARRRKSWARD